MTMTKLGAIEQELTDTNKAFRSHCVLRSEEIAALIRYVRAAEEFFRLTDAFYIGYDMKDLKQARRDLGLE